MVSIAFALPQIVTAGEGGTTHVIPGSMSTLIDNAPTAPGMIIKPMYLNYSGSATKQIPTAAGLAGNLDATANTFVLAGIYAFEGKVLGGDLLDGRRVCRTPGWTSRPTCRHAAE